MVVRDKLLSWLISISLAVWIGSVIFCICTCSRSMHGLYLDEEYDS